MSKPRKIAITDMLLLRATLYLESCPLEGALDVAVELRAALSGPGDGGAARAPTEAAERELREAINDFALAYAVQRKELARIVEFARAAERAALRSAAPAPAGGGSE